MGFVLDVRADPWYFNQHATIENAQISFLMFPNNRILQPRQW